MNTPTTNTPRHPCLNTALQWVNPVVSLTVLHDEATERLSKAAGILDMVQSARDLPRPLADALWAAHDLVDEAHDILNLLWERQNTEAD